MSRIRQSIAGLLTCLTVAGFSQVSVADNADPPRKVQNLDRDPSRPWAKGVSTEQQDKADALFGEGNELLKGESYAAAVDKYTQALEQWNHPAISYNQSIALNNLDRLVEMYHALENALSHGIPALGTEKFYNRAQSSLDRVSGKVAIITITCDEPGAIVTMSGQQLFKAPGSHRAVLMPGDYFIRATKRGRLPTEEKVVVFAGDKENVDLILYIEVIQTVYARSRKWERGFAAGGAAALLGGLALDLISRSGFDKYDQDFAELCIRGVDDVGCSAEQIPQSMKQQLETSRAQTWGARIVYGLGASAVITGAVLWILNRPKIIRTKVRSREGRKPRSVSITPMINDTDVGLGAYIRF